MAQRYYLRNSKFPFEEDETHEFKGHRTISEQEFNQKSAFVGTDGKFRRFRQPWSKYICGILNSGRGGTLYGGILDDGTIEGFMLTPFQQHHVALSLYDTLKSFDPPVPPDLYEVNFVPVIDDEREVKALSSSMDMMMSAQRRKFELKQHFLRTPRKCWCDYEAKAMLENSLLSPFYVVEVSIAPWKPKDARFFKSETGQYFFRRNATTTKYSSEEIQQFINN